MSAQPHHPDDELPTASAEMKISVAKIGEISGSARFPGSKSDDLVLMAGTVGTGTLIVVGPGFTIGATHSHLSTMTTTTIVVLQLFAIAATFAIAMAARRRRRQK
jgi:hypothetical protein